MDPALRDGFAGHTGMRVDVLVAVSHRIGIRDPAHFSSPGSHVRSRNVQTVGVWECTV